jgi:hypothetical protein
MFSANRPNWITFGLLAPVAAASAFLFFTPWLFSQAAQADNLQQNIDLIKQILDKGGLYTRTTVSAGGDYKSVTQRKFSVKSAIGCRLIVASDAHMHTDMPVHKRTTDRTWTDYYRPDLSLLDPATVIVQDPQPAQPTWEAKGYLVRIAVETGKTPIAASSVNHETNQEKDLPGAPNLAVYVTSREEADRLAKAFTQAATACHAR